MSARRYIKSAEAVGQTFGRLTVRSLEYRGNRAFGVCSCVCGGNCVSLISKLRSGYTKSCGCLKNETTAKRNTTHGLSGIPTYASWRAMKNRCNNQNSSDYQYYGGRGIQICQRWMSFENFLLDMGERPDGMEIDRIDNNGNYEPGNCRWASRAEQTRNSRRARVFKISGRRFCLTELAAILGITPKVLRRKLKDDGPDVMSLAVKRLEQLVTGGR